MVCLLLWYLQIVPVHSGSSDELLVENKKNLGEVLGAGVAQWIMFTLKCENQYSGPQHLGGRDMGSAGKKFPPFPSPACLLIGGGRGVRDCLSQAKVFSPLPFLLYALLFPIPPLPSPIPRLNSICTLKTLLRAFARLHHL